MNLEEKKEYLLNALKNNPKTVETNIFSKGKRFNRRKVFFEFKEDIDRFLDKGSEDRFFAMPGLRGVGKTTLLFQLFDYLVNERGIDKSRVLYLDLDRLKDHNDLNLREFFDIFISDINEEAYFNNEPLFIFVDESQYTDNWALVGKIFYDELKNCFMIFTGSNALNLESNHDAARRVLKKYIFPLNFSEYLNLKYFYDIPTDLESSFEELIFEGKIDNLAKLENNIKLNIFLDLKRDVKKEWETFMQYKELPFTFNRFENNAINLTLEMKDRIIEKDLDLIKSFSSQTKMACYPLLNTIALQKPGTLPLETLSKYLNISKRTVSELLSTLEDAQVIFHVEPRGSIMKRIRKPWEYYFLSTQMKACIYQQRTQVSSSKGEYMGSLIENYVASSLFRLKQKSIKNFGIFFDDDKGNVDFLIYTIDGVVIPIEVGIGKKSKKQISKAIRKYNSPHGIIISNKEKSIKKDGNIIYITPLIFSML